jgi:hypothetical protein
MTSFATSSVRTSQLLMLVCHDDLPYQDRPSTTAPASAPSPSESPEN